MEILNNNNIILHNNINNFRNNNDNFMNNRNNRNNRIDRIIRNYLMNNRNIHNIHIDHNDHIRRENRKVLVTYISGEKKEFTTFQECVEYNEGTNTYDNIKILDCSYLNLKKIIWMLPQNLQKFNCSHNRLKQLPWALPPHLEEIDCSYNQLISLPDYFPVNLKVLNCSRNLLISLPEHFPPNLQKLFCNYNILTQIPWDIPNTLQILNCSYNGIRKFHKSFAENFKNLRKLICNNNSLDCLPDNMSRNLQRIECHHNYLRSLPENLPLNLRVLFCNNNILISLPISITRLRHIRELIYDNNIQHIPPQVQRWINRIVRVQRVQRVPRVQRVQRIQGYNIQNVHNHSIQKSVRESIEKITSQHFEIDIDLIIEDMLSDDILTEQCKQSIIQYCNNRNVHSVLQLTFKELFGYVWKTIKENEHCDEIKGILNIEMNNARCKCFTGKISRLINCLNGFSDLVRIELSDNEQIGNIIILVKNRLTREDNYSVETHKEIVKRELTERGYTEEIITEWTGYID